MAKRDVTATEHKIEEFAEDLGRLLGTARAKAEGWLGQRRTIVKNLTDLRDTATKLLTDLGHEAQRVVRRGRPAGPRNQPRFAKQPVSRKKRRKMSAKARAAISAAQKARWAKLKAGKK